jgi:hypothetical protein
VFVFEILRFAQDDGEAVDGTIGGMTMGSRWNRVDSSRV